MIPCILYAEDEADDVYFLNRAVKKASVAALLEVVQDGQCALDYLAGAGSYADREAHPFPALVLLDIHMPKKSGFEVLEWIRRQPGLKTLPVIMFTSSTHSADRDKALRLAANDYLEKSSDPLEFAQMARSLYNRWVLHRAV